MKHLKEIRLTAFLTLAFLVMASVGCNKEEITLDGQQPGGANALQSKNPALEAVHLKVEEEQAAVKQSEQEAGAYRQALQQELAEQLERRQAFRRDQVSTRSDKAVINVPGDYSTLQEAIDAAQPGGTIHLTGEIAGGGAFGFVVVDVEGLRIQATEPLGATVNDYVLLIAAPKVEIQNLHLVMEAAVVINGTTGFKVKNNVIEGWEGLAIIDSSEGTIQNNQIKGTQYGASFLRESDHILFANNQIEGNKGYLVELLDSHNNQFSNCSVNGLSLADRGFNLYGSTQNTFKQCTVKNVRLTSFLAETGSNGNSFRECASEYGNFGFLSRFSSNDNSYTNCRAKAHNQVGYYFFQTAGTKVSNCQAVDCQAYGTLFEYGSNVLVEKSSATGCFYGFILAFCETSTIKSNEAYANLFQGILLFGVDGCLVGDNIANDNSETGISLEYSDNNTLAKNTAQNNGGCDFQLLGDIANNTLSKNSFGSECD